jgi:hypothetical protein
MIPPLLNTDQQEEKTCGPQGTNSASKYGNYNDRGSSHHERNLYRINGC